jgi:general secretion pathway protein I
VTGPRRTISSRGFTLPEVLAALVLIGVVLPVAMRGIAASTTVAARARHVAEATELARHKLTELSLLADSNGYTGGGELGTDWPDYRYESRASEREYGVTEVTVEVFWKSRGQDESVTLSTLAYPNQFTTGSTSSDTGSGTSTNTGGATP